MGDVTGDWVEEAEADTYFDTRFGADDFWVSGTAKEAALKTAQKMIEDSGLFANWPSASGEEVTEAMLTAICEQALFLVIQGSALDDRLALQSMGVTGSTIVGETYIDRAYLREKNRGTGICERAYQAMQAGGYLKSGLGFKYDSPSGSW